MKRFTLFAVAAIISAAAIAFAGNYRLPIDGTGKYPVTQYAPQSHIGKGTTSAVKGSHVNITTSGFAAVKCVSRAPASVTAAGAATVAKVRFGGYSTGNETGYYPTAEDTYWNPPATIGFRNYSGALEVDCTKQP
jgi:hypothetical protein